MNEVLELVFKSPVANLLIIAGLVVLGIAVVDNVSGKIHPVTAGRLLSDLLGLCLLKEPASHLGKEKRVRQKRDRAYTLGHVFHKDCPRSSALSL
jgi:hypothetical protein